MVQKRKKSFFKGMLIYALIYLAVLAAGLTFFWNFIDAYERSRPKNTVDAYVDTLTPAYMCEKDTQTEGWDENIQSREERDAVIAASLTERITYARKSSESTEERQLYMLRCGSRVIGQLTIRALEPDMFGFTEWVVAEDAFDFSGMMGKQRQITVPENYAVFANGRLLDDGYITEREMEYSALEEFYDSYSLPTMVTYTVSGYYGELDLTAADEAGQPAEVNEEMDRNVFLDNCDREERTQTESFMEDFLESYITFTGGSNRAGKENYIRLRSHFLIPDSDLARRLYSALDGLAFAQSNGDRLMDVAFHLVSRLPEGRYFCDVTYTVSTYGIAGEVRTENNMKVILLETENGLRVEAMTRY